MNQPAVQERFSPDSSVPQLPAFSGLVGLNTRVDPAISSALLRVSMDRRLQRQPRSKLQDIVAEALTEFLRKQGYLS